MNSKKVLICIIAALVMAGAFSATVFASGAGQNEATPGNCGRYPLCAVETCTRVSYHSHNGTTYASHHGRGGHSYHRPAAAPTYRGVCPIEGCRAIGKHTHDGGQYGRHHSGDGYAYRGTQPNEETRQAGGGQGRHHGGHGHH